jgi:hypothetical protein
MVKIASRDSWKPRHQNGDLNLSGLATHVVLHHSVTKQLPEDASVEDEREQMRAIEAVGQSRFGTGISYNVVVFPSGRAYQGVSFNRRGTHTGGHNSTRRSITFAGNYENAEPTRAQLDTARAIVAEGRGKWWRKDAPVEGHRDYKSTACPGKNVYKNLSYIAGGGTTKPKPSKPATPVPPGKVAVDEVMGPRTVTALQRELGTLADGLISSQSTANRKYHTAVTAVTYWPRPKGSACIVALQRKLGVKPDGHLGPVTIGKWQQNLGVHDDGYLGPKTVRAVQESLNDGKLW